MKLAIIFNGQGAHYKGMALDFVVGYPEAKEVFEVAQQVTGEDVLALVDKEFDQLSQTRYSQIAIASTSLAIYKSVAPQLPEVAFMAGLSLGEYSALIASDMLSLEDGLKLIQHRGSIMGDHCQELALEVDIQMCAVMRMPLKEIEKLTKEIHSPEMPLYIANMNASHQTILAGTADSIEEFAKRAKEEGYKRPIPLKVEGPFHSPMMAPACEPFAKVLAETEFQENRIPVISNTTLRPHRLLDVRDSLVRHLVEPVQWTQTIDVLIEEGVTHLIQIGPGETLARLLKREKESLPCLVIDKVEDAEDIQAFLEGGHQA